MAKSENKGTPDKPLIILEWERKNSTFAKAEGTEVVHFSANPDGTLFVDHGVFVEPADDIKCGTRKPIGNKIVSKPIKRVLYASHPPEIDDFLTK